MADATLTLYQAEWCPFSSAVREVLTELGIDFVARQVEPWPKDRNELRAAAGTDQIPVLQTEDGGLYRGTREIFAHLPRRGSWSSTSAGPTSSSLGREPLPRPRSSMCRKRAATSSGSAGT